MLVIRKTQMEALKKAADVSFEEKILIHLNQFFPDAFAAMESSGALQMIRHGIRSAKHHGFKSERNVCKYIDVMVVFGPHFDQSPKFPWAAKILSDNNITDNKARINLLVASALVHTDKQEG